VVLAEVISVIVAKITRQPHVEIGYLPQLLIGLAALVLVFNLHLASQRKLLSKVSEALIAATSYAERLEQFSFVDPQTQLFNRRYLDQLFNQQLKWLNRNGRPATLVLLEVCPDGQRSTLEESAVEAAFVLQSTFRGSDYVLRNSTGQFLVLLPDTTEHQAQYAMNRLAEKMDTWNLEHQFGMALRHELSTCPPGGDFWEALRKIEDRLRGKRDFKGDLRSADAHGDTELTWEQCPQTRRHP
jgi:GGDEF domain-containing protein